jgi:hypothetical protein
MLEGLRILVAEDDLLLAEVVVTALDKAGCVVTGPAPRLAKTIELAGAKRAGRRAAGYQSQW